METRISHREALTLFALAHPIARERRGGVIVDGGHGRRTIDIIPCAIWPRLCILLGFITSGSWHRVKRLPKVTQCDWGKRKVREVEDRRCGIGSGGASRGCGEGRLRNGAKILDPYESEYVHLAILGIDENRL